MTEQIENLEETKKASHILLAQEELLAYATYIDPGYQTPDHIQLLAGYLEALERGDITRLIITMPPQHGKEFAKSTPVLTPTGWKLHGDLHVGDYVFGREGQPVKVLAVGPEIESDCLVTIAGEEFVTHQNHEWLVYDRSCRRERKLETKQLLNIKLTSGFPGKRGCHHRFSVDANVPIQFQKQELALHPYILGLWLGDGDSSTGRICHSPKDVEHINKAKGLGYEVTTTTTHRTTGVLYENSPKLAHALKALGLQGNKHIPDEYLHSSIEQRLELLAGLVDTDGWVYQANGRVTFVNCNPILVGNVEELVRSLGWNPVTCWYDPVVSSSNIVGKQPVAQVCFNPTYPIPTALPRKATSNTSPVVRRRPVESVRLEGGLEAGNCIEVEGGVYLVGKSLVPTCNSELTSGKFPGWCIGRDPSRVCMAVGHTAEFIVTFSVQNRDTIDKNPKYREIFPHITLNPSRKGMFVWGVNQQRENFIASGITGGITGFGAWLITIDDPIKTHEQATSPAYKEKVWNEYLAAARTRLRPDGRIIVIMTRWAEDDLAGRLLEDEKNGGDHWEVVHLPALSFGLPEDYGYGVVEPAVYEEAIKKIPKTAFPDRLGRHKDDPLWPTRYDKTFLKRARATMREKFTSMYQGMPGAIEGNKFKRAWFRAITEESIRQLKLVPIMRARAWDLAWSSSKRANNTVGTRCTLYKVPVNTSYDPTGVGALLGLNTTMPPVIAVLEDVQMVHEEWDDAANIIADTAVKDTITYDLFMEAVAAQSVWVKSLRADPRLAMHRIVGVQTDSDKETNALTAQRFGALGVLFMLWPSSSVSPEWLEEWLDSVCLFPNAAEDDRVDSLAQLMNKWQPTIDELLNDTSYGEWSTALGEKKRTVKYVRPRELTPDDDPEEPSVDALGWEWTQ